MAESGWIDNSGWAGVAERLVNAYATKKLRKRAAEEDASARERYYKGEMGAKAEQEARDAQRKREEVAAEQRQREELAKRYGLRGRDQMRYVLEGKVGEGVRGVPTMTDQGLVNVNPYTGEGVPVSIGGQQQDVRIDPALAGNPEAMAAIRQDMANGAPAGDQNYQVQARRPLMPYRDPAEAQRQAAADARAAEQLRLAQNADKRAEVAAQAKANPQVSPQMAAYKQDAINFAAAYIGKSPEEVAKMTPEQIRTAVKAGGRLTAGPIMGALPGMDRIANADLKAYTSSAASKLARINNPTGTVTNADFLAAEKSVFSPDKPAEVNADLIFQALSDGASNPQPQQPSGGGLSPQEQQELDALRKRFGR